MRGSKKFGPSKKSFQPVKRGGGFKKFNDAQNFLGLCPDTRIFHWGEGEGQF